MNAQAPELADADLRDVAELGKAAQEFLDSDLGKSILASAEQDVRAALERMADLDLDDPADRKKHTECRIEVKASRMFAEKLAQIVDIGETALAVWSQQNPKGERNAP
mgnify:FL=1